MAADYSTALGDVGGAVSSLFGARGARASARSYGIAQTFAEENAKLSESATKLKLEQQQRQIFGVLGTQKAQVAGAGFAASGTALDLLRSSASQGAMTKAITAEQGAIQATSYYEQAAMYGGMKAAADTSSVGQTIAGLLQGAGAIAAIVG
jgi:hypothetical protein